MDPQSTVPPDVWFLRSPGSGIGLSVLQRVYNAIGKQGTTVAVQKFISQLAAAMESLESFHSMRRGR